MGSTIIASPHIHNSELALSAWQSLKVVDGAAFKEHLWPRIKELPLTSRYYLAEKMILSSTAPQIIKITRTRRVATRTQGTSLRSRDLKLSPEQRKQLQIAGEIAARHGNKELGVTLLLEVTAEPALSSAIMQKAVHLFGTAGDSRAVFYLAGLMYNNNNQKVRERAARSLGKIGGEQSFVILQDSIQHPDPAIRRAAVLGVSKSNDSRFTPILINALTDQAPKVRRSASLILARNKDAATLELLLAELDSDNTNLRVEIIKTLGACGDQRTQLILENLAGNLTEEREVQKAANKALQRLRK